MPTETERIDLPCGCGAETAYAEGDGGLRPEVYDTYRVSRPVDVCTKKHRRGDVVRRVYTVTTTLVERHYFDPRKLQNEFGTPQAGETYEDFVARVFQRFDGSEYGDEHFPSDANPQVGYEVSSGWSDD